MRSRITWTKWIRHFGKRKRHRRIPHQGDSFFLQHATMPNQQAQSDRFAHSARWFLTGLFTLRIVAQPLSLLVPGLPAFDTWHGSVMPYPVLLASQLAILALMISVNIRLGRHHPLPRPGLARMLTLFGWVYFMGMLVRLVVGQSIDAAPAWFDRPLPSFFHLVLATWILIVGRSFANHAH